MVLMVASFVALERRCFDLTRLSFSERERHACCVGASSRSMIVKKMIVNTNATLGLRAEERSCEM